MDIVGIKKELDKDINVYGPIFSEDLVKKYLGFIQLCFVPFSGWEHKEKIKSLYELRQEHFENGMMIGFHSLIQIMLLRR